MHERNIFHGKLHGENVLVRGQDTEEKLCLVDYAYSNLCTRNAITQLVHDSPSFCGNRRSLSSLVDFLSFFADRSTASPPGRIALRFVGSLAIGHPGVLLVSVCCREGDGCEGCVRSLTGEYPFHGSSKKIFQQILNGTVDFHALEWEHISSNGHVSGAGLVVSDSLFF